MPAVSSATEMGKLLSFLYAQVRGLIAYIFEGKLEEAAAHVELFVQVYGILSVRIRPRRNAGKSVGGGRAVLV